MLYLYYGAVLPESCKGQKEALHVAYIRIFEIMTHIPTAMERNYDYSLVLTFLCLPRKTLCSLYPKGKHVPLPQTEKTQIARYKLSW